MCVVLEPLIGFNSATAKRPWRTQCIPGTHCRVWRASIRPQPKGRGELPRSLYEIPCTVSLQFGHSQKAVENYVNLERHTFFTEGLQFGHSQKAVENMPSPTRTIIVTTSFNSATAKRPWRTHRQPRTTRHRLHGFNSATAKRPWRTLSPGHAYYHRPRRASIRPQPKGRGEHEPTESRGSFHRRFNSATAKRPWRTTVPIRVTRPLQFGHSQRPWRTSSANSFNFNSATGPPHDVARRRNSATAKRPWRTCSHVPARMVDASIRPQPKGRGELAKAQPTGLSMLQFGHSQKAVENDGTPLSAKGFNSATAKRPWRTGRGQGCSVDNELQFGHSQKAVENCKPCSEQLF